MNTKVCSKCGIEKEFSEFGKQKGGKNGLRARCNECRIEDHKIYNETHKESINKKHREYRKKNKDKCSAYGKEYRERDPEKWRQWHAEYREKNKEIIAFRNSRWNKTVGGREKQRMILVKRRTIEKNLPSTLTTEQWEEIKEIFHNSCAYCGEKTKLAQDHFVPLTKGGEHSKSNIIPSCISCNSSKSNNDFFEWYPYSKNYNKQREKFILNHLNYNKFNQQLTFDLL